MLAEILAHVVDRFAEKLAVVARKVDEFENVELLVRRCELNGAESLFIDDEHLAGGDFADERRADGVERAGFGGDDIAAVQFAEYQWTDAVGVARRDERIFGHRDDRKRAGEEREALSHRFFYS